MSLFGYTADMCPKCGCNNAPLVYLGKDKGWLYEDCLEKQIEEQRANEEREKS